MKVSYKLISTLLASKLGMIKYSQSTQSNKFVMSLQYLEKEVRDGVHVLHANNCQSLKHANV